MRLSGLVVVGALLLAAGAAHAAPPLPVLSLSGGPASEGTTATFTLRLSRPSAKRVRVRYATQDGTAKAGEDYVARSGAVTLKPRQRKVAIAVEVTDDSLAEDDETFYIELSRAIGARLASRELQVKIAFSDLPGPFTLRATALPGPDGFGSATGTFTFDPAAEQVTYTTTSQGLHERPFASHIHPNAEDLMLAGAIVLFPTPVQEGTVTGTLHASRGQIIAIYLRPESAAFHVHTPTIGQWLDGRLRRP